MSHLLWKYYWENDVDKFRRLLHPTGASTPAISKSPPAGSLDRSSPTSFASTPRTIVKSRKGATPKSKAVSNSLGKAEVNSRDHAGLTVLLRAASSSNPTAREFARALVEHPAIDLYIQDPESGWNALHRSLYSGNVSIARILLAREREILLSGTAASIGRVGRLIKTKDHEGNSPFDVYNATIATRSLNRGEFKNDSDNDSWSGQSTGDASEYGANSSQFLPAAFQGDELFIFGSNQNISLGVGDQDDRQYPERIHLQRPDGLLRRFYNSHLSDDEVDYVSESLDTRDIPIVIRSRPLTIQDVAMSKLHTAVLTTDPVSNLYICGVGRGGRLGLGDENTKFKFTPVLGPLSEKKICQVALGQNHTMAIVGNGELWTWGLNSDSQLGYLLPPPTRTDELPMSLVPRQVFGVLKKELIQGIAASAVHSVAHTGTSLFCWGRNFGQLALMDADSRSLDIQTIPRRVAASLITAPISTVSAINKATTVLLANHSVWVFTNYGYNLIKFPTLDVFANYKLTSYAHKHDYGKKEIVSIASGGDTIAAATSRGDLFTMTLNTGGDIDQPSGSTTNPAKIRNAVSQPRCVWDSRKDGVVSMSISEHGSVIICTESGAVWKRVKRTKGNISSMSFAGAKKKDFKFERIPYITNCVKVRSSTFGAFAAVRQDSKVMSQEISVAKPFIWEDIGSLLCLNSFDASDPNFNSKDSRKAWDSAILREKPGSVVYRLLKSPDIESDLLRMLQSNNLQAAVKTELFVCTSFSPEIKIPVHSWLLSARSPVLLTALSNFRRNGSQSHEDLFVLSKEDGIRILTFQQIDILTLLNMVVFVYLDALVPVWKYTKEASSFAHRYRQVRTELMKTAARLRMVKLESAARLQGDVESSLDSDLQSAISDKRFFEDGDILVQLDGEDLPLHSQLVCQRCPFFHSMFHGRSQGEWLAHRRADNGTSDQLEIDLKHINPETFSMVIQYMYGDVGEDLFQDVVSESLDEFSEVVLDVMATANELMLDRLSQACQSLIGKFVTTRNIARLLNEISPCSVTEFKDVGLEYICLQLENMLENGNLDGMDEDLLLELDEIVRENQLARLPYVRSGHFELVLHEKYPHLVADIEEERQRRVREFAFKASQREEERKLSSSYRTRFGSLDEVAAFSEAPYSNRRKSKIEQDAPFSPNLRPRKSQGELIFAMDEDVSKVSTADSPDVHTTIPQSDIDAGLVQLSDATVEANTLSLSKSPASPAPMPALSEARNSMPAAGESVNNPARKTSGPWASSNFSTTKLDLRNIMSETSPKPSSALTANLAATSRDVPSLKPPYKMSQKERKKQMQMQMQAELPSRVANDKPHVGPWQPVASSSKAAPWKTTSATPKVSLQEAMASQQIESRGTIPQRTKPLVASETEPQAKCRTASPDTKFSGQNRSRKATAAAGNAANASTSHSSAAHSQSSRPLVPHSKSYITREHKEDYFYGGTLADIIGQQKREQEMVKEAVAKRSLQEIQQEQAFQEWWDQESRRAQEEETQRLAKACTRERGDGGGGKRERRGAGVSGVGGGVGAGDGSSGSRGSKGKGKDVGKKVETSKSTPGSGSGSGSKSRSSVGGKMAASRARRGRSGGNRGGKE